MQRTVDSQYIQVLKFAEDELYADYFFCSDVWVPDEMKKGINRHHQTNFGRLTIDKLTGEIIVVCPMPDDLDGKRASRAIRVIKKHWQDGHLPAATRWASG